MIDLYNHPLNVEAARHWLDGIDRALLDPADLSFVEDCAGRLDRLGMERWEPTADDWNRMRELYEKGAA